jgi:hypothetical protein
MLNQHSVDLLAGILGNDVIHEIQELAPPAPGVVPRSHLTRGDVERCKQRRRAMPLVAVAKSVHRSAIRQAQVALRSLQRLNVRLLVDTRGLPLRGHPAAPANHLWRTAVATYDTRAGRVFNVFAMV